MADTALAAEMLRRAQQKIDDHRARKYDTGVNEAARAAEYHKNLRRGK
jgi:hypothetical protein